MFGPSYFGTSYYGSTYFGPGLEVEENTAGKYKGKLPKKKDSQDLIDGLKAFYGEPEAIPETLLDVPDLPEIEAVPIELETVDDYLTEKLDFLESQVEMAPETRHELERTQDIGLILAIIEAVD